MVIICVALAASFSIISGVILYTMIVRPLGRLNEIMIKLCTSVSVEPSPHGSEDALGRLEDGLRCIAGQWEQSRQRLEESNRQEIARMEKLATLGEMAFSVAHDIKNPLAGISGAIQVFAEDFPEEDPRGDIVREILAEIARLDRTVKDLQSYARPPVPHPMKAPVQFLLERAVRDISENAKNFGIDVRISEKSENLEIYVDTELLHQALMNIMDFGIKNMPDGGTLTLYSRTSADRNMSEILISDSSSGLRGESMETLFKPFRASRMSLRGLSMAISRAIVEMHGGGIKVESSPGAGTTFRIALPLHREDA